jgi:hypothetical protein
MQTGPYRRGVGAAAGGGGACARGPQGVSGSSLNRQFLQKRAAIPRTRRLARGAGLVQLPGNAFRTCQHLFFRTRAFPRLAERG